MNPHVPEEYGGLGLPGFDGMLIGEELSWGCAGMPSRSSRTRSAPARAARRHRRAEARVAAAAARGADPLLLRPHRARRRLGRRPHQDDGRAPRRRVRPQRLEDLHHQRGPRGLDGRLREDRPAQAATGLSAFVVPDGRARRHDREAPRQDGPALDRHVGVLADRRRRPGREPPRRGGRRLQDRDADARLTRPGHGRRRGRRRAGRVRARRRATRSSASPSTCRSRCTRASTS